MTPGTGAMRVAIGACLLTVITLAPAGVRAADRPVTVFLLRHAEPAATKPDPDLAPAGQRRAEALAALLGRSGVTHLYASELQRTRQTLGPLARRTGVEVQVVPARAGAQQLQVLRALPAGSVAVVCGHSNTVPRLVEGLGGQVHELVDHPDYGPIMAHTSFDRLFVVVRAGSGSSQTLELRYGSPSSDGDTRGSGHDGDEVEDPPAQGAGPGELSALASLSWAEPLREEPPRGVGVHADPGRRAAGLAHP